jgi:hypothetical protein
MLGRFMGMDPVGVNDTNLHSHNRYAYANNNPYRFVDRDGREATLALCAGGPAACVVGVALAGATAYYGVKALQDINAILQNRTDKGEDGAELLRGTSAAASPGGMPPDDEGNSNDGRGKSVNQINKDVKTDKTPDGIKRADTGKVKGEQDHIHFKNGNALNRDGSWKHVNSSEGLTRAQERYVTEAGFKLPK